MTYKVFFKSAEYGDIRIDELDSLSEHDRDVFVEKLADEISRIGLDWHPEFSEVVGPIDFDPGMDDTEFAEWFGATCDRLWGEYCESAWAREEKIEEGNDND